ncbi:MAG: FHA domain-containing protein [Hydrogenophaga sp.]
MSWVVELLHRDGSVLSRLPAPQQHFTLGRALDNDLVLDDPHAAAHHAEILFVDHLQARLKDLGSVNGIAPQRGKKAPEILIQNDGVLRVGSSSIRVRSSDWPIAPEQRLAGNHMAAWALVLLGLVLLNQGWETWLMDRLTESPPYLYALAGLAGGLALWSAAYALYGRLANGENRFFSHLLIACTGYLGLTAMENATSKLGFASGWLWPMQWQPYLLGLGVALTVRAHLRTADPRHWPTTRWGLALVTVVAMAVPLAQQWISHQELTSVRTMDELSYPALRWAPEVPLDRFLGDVQRLKADADQAREIPAGSEADDGSGEE